MAKKSLFPLSEPLKGLTEIRGRSAAGSIVETGERLQGGRESAAGEAVDGTVWWTHRMNQEANHHNDSYQNIITAESNQVQPGRLPKTSGPIVGRPSQAQPLGKNTNSLED